MPDVEKNKKILAAVDFSDDSASAVVYAAKLAKRLGDTLIVLHVVHDQAGSPGYYSNKKIKKGDKKRLKRLEEIAAEMMDEFIQKRIENHPDIKSVLKKAELVMVSGLTVTKILQVIEKMGPEMLVLGNRGRTSLKHILLGSKAEQLVRLCQIPVTLVKK
ncbi:MAG: universal stress protein [Candidatus Thiodiazotropha sp. (ex Notomyrtea botanica)]|nr:universal stress protein [Candidatus Thiodiazotropha sp. (ex Notomyrtea botanica)]